MNRQQIELTPEEHLTLMEGWKKGKKHTFRSRCNMVLLNYQGYSRAEIGAIEGTSRQAVGRWLKRYKDGGIEALHTAHGRGRPPIVRHDNEPIINKIEQLVEQYPQKLEQALAKIEEFTGKSMSKKTLQRILKKTAGHGNASAEVYPSGRRPKS